MWAAEWRSKSRLNGERRYLIRNNLLVCLFRTRRECRDFIEQGYGYIKHRKDLRQEPHGWRLPVPVRVEVRKESRRG